MACCRQDTFNYFYRSICPVDENNSFFYGREDGYMELIIV